MLIQRLCTLADLAEIERLAIASQQGITSCQPIASACR